jgi:predicted metal-dependent hydrolase
MTAMDRAGFTSGIELFNRGEFFEAHEVLEDVWRAAPAHEKMFLQGVIQVAVALHHYARGNAVGACSLMRRAHKNLSAYPESFAGLNVAELLAAVANWQAALETGGRKPSLPRLELKGRTSSGS